MNKNNYNLLNKDLLTLFQIVLCLSVFVLTMCVYFYLFYNPTFKDYYYREGVIYDTDLRPEIENIELIISGRNMYSLYRVKANGKIDEEVINFKEFGYRIKKLLSVSPSKRYIVIELVEDWAKSTNDVLHNSDIYLVDLNELSIDELPTYSSPGWSEDEKQIVYANEKYNNDTRILDKFIEIYNIENLSLDKSFFLEDIKIEKKGYSYSGADARWYDEKHIVFCFPEGVLGMLNTETKEVKILSNISINRYHMNEGPMSIHPSDSVSEIQETYDKSIELLYGSKTYPYKYSYSEGDVYFYQTGFQGFWSKTWIEGFDRNNNQRFKVMTIGRGIFQL